MHGEIVSWWTAARRCIPYPERFTHIGTIARDQQQIR
jgi:hypothetical protein